MNVPSYGSPPAHRVALEKRLRNICESLDLNELRTRTSLAHTVIAQLLPAGVVKGGAAIKFRTGDHASRVTRDLDATRAAGHTVESYAAELSDRLAEGWHGFTGRLVDRVPAGPLGVPDDYVMNPFDVKLAYAGQSYVTIEFELGHDEVGSTTEPRLALDVGIADVIERLGFPTPAPVAVLAVEHQVAQKLHTCTTPNRQGGNERAHDLVDLQILVAADLRSSSSWPESAGDSSKPAEPIHGHPMCVFGRAGKIATRRPRKVSTCANSLTPWHGYEVSSRRPNTPPRTCNQRSGQTTISPHSPAYYAVGGGICRLGCLKNR